MEQLRFPNCRHPFAGRAVETARYDDVRFMRQVRVARKWRIGRSWAGWFTNKSVKKQILAKRKG